jgi:hypothetical protein
MKKYFFVLSCLGFSFVARAQDNTNAPYLLKNTFIDATVSFASKQLSGALAWQKLHGIGKNEQFKIGYGFRFNTYFVPTKIILLLLLRLREQLVLMVPKIMIL